MLENPPNQRAIIRKKIVGRVNAWKKRGEKWWHPRFANLIKYILLMEPRVEGWCCGISLHRSRALDASSPSENTLKNALFAEVPARAGLCGPECDFFNFPHSHPFPPLLNPPGNSSEFIGERTKALPAKATLGRQQNISCIY